MMTTVLLDAGGVILDESEHERVRIDIATRVLQRVVPGYAEAALRADLDEAIAVFCPRILAFVIWKRVKPDRALFERLYDEFRAEWARRRPGLTLMAGFKQEIAMISPKFKVGIAGQYGGEIVGLLEQEGILHHFAYRFTQDDFDITKPDPRYLEEIARACGVKPAECIMVGDRIDNDIIPAKQVGMRTVLIRWGLHRKQAPRIPDEVPDEVLAGITGLAGAIGRLAAV
jgi:putative hydrolase of the HAD superfamily